VLEHVPAVSHFFSYAHKKLKKAGLFLALTPNGSEAFRSRQKKSWNKLWGMVHPNFLDDRFYKKAYPNALLASAPNDYLQIKQQWSGGCEPSHVRRL
jgi:hypothetical protein